MRMAMLPGKTVMPVVVVPVLVVMPVFVFDCYVLMYVNVPFACCKIRPDCHYG